MYNNVMTLAERYAKHIEYWIWRLHVPHDMQEDARQEGHLQLLKDAAVMSAEEVEYKSWYNVGKAIGKFLAVQKHHYQDLQTAKIHNYDRTTINIDAVNPAHLIAPEPHKCPYNEIWSIICTYLTPAEIEMINTVWYVPSSHLPFYLQADYKLLKRGRKRQEWKKSTINRLRRLAKHSGIDVNCSQPRLLEKIRCISVKNVCRIMQQLGMAEVEISRNKQNTYKPFIHTIQSKKYF